MTIAAYEIQPQGLYWLHSPRGPDDNREFKPYRLIGGVLNAPLPGTLALEHVARGLVATVVDSSDVPLPSLSPDPAGGWVIVAPSTTRQDAPPEPSSPQEAALPAPSPGPGLPPLDDVSEWPEELPDDYQMLFEMYTKSGRKRSGW